MLFASFIITSQGISFEQQRWNRSHYNNLTNNTASNNSVGINLFHYPSYFNNLTGNTIKNNGVGISIRGHNNNFMSNIVSNNSQGFSLYYSANNTLKNNTISYNSV